MLYIAAWTWLQVIQNSVIFLRSSRNLLLLLIRIGRKLCCCIIFLLLWCRILKLRLGRKCLHWCNLLLTHSRRHSPTYILFALWSLSQRTVISLSLLVNFTFLPMVLFPPSLSILFPYALSSLFDLLFFDLFYPFFHFVSKQQNFTRYLPLCPLSFSWKLMMLSTSLNIFFFCLMLVLFLSGTISPFVLFFRIVSEQPKFC